MDELFNSDVKWVMDFCDALDKNNLKIVYKTGGGRVDTVSEQLLTRMYNSGCININYGQESSKNNVGTEQLADRTKEKRVCFAA